MLKLFKRSFLQLTSRPLYVCAMLVPLAFCVFMITLMSAGLPLPVPVGVVDRDGSQLSRRLVRSLEAAQTLDIATTPLSYDDAFDDVRSGRTYGFFYIPEGFQQKALSGQDPSVTFFSNMSIYVPGTMTIKGFKATAVSTKGALVATTFTSLGMPSEEAVAMLSPVVWQEHRMGNPWMNYAVYLDPSFCAAMLQLMILIVTVFSLGEEVKNGTGPEWLSESGGSMVVALMGKLLPQTVIFTLVGWACQALMFGFDTNPLNCPLGHMLLAMFLMVAATQALGIFIFELLPNLRLGLVVCALVGILTFSVAGYSFPVQQMYGGIGIFSYILPACYYFLIYIDQALNGLPMYWSRWWYAALCVFPLVAMPMLRHLRRRMQDLVYVA